MMTAQPDVPPKTSRPAHVAIIMDGNGRWAVEHGLPRIEGHRRGADIVRDITTYCRELEIPHLTLFSFSTENWRRPPAEVAGLMLLLEEFCVKERDTLMKNQIKLTLIGRSDRLPSSTREALQTLIHQTRENTGMTLTLAIDYGAREDITRGIRKLVKQVQDGTLGVDSIDEQTVDAALDTVGIPDPDLVMRTSGEMRLSNFLLWQMAYSELYFTPVRWPDFQREHLAAGLHEYARRQRRFGAVGE